LKSKFIVLTTLLAAAVLLPTGFAVADLYFDMTRASETVDGTGSFTGLNGASGVATFYNDTTSTQYAVVLGFIDNQITLIDISTPTSPNVVETFGDGTGTLKYDGPLDGPRNIALFGNDSDTDPFSCGTINTSERCEVLGIVTNTMSDSVSIFNFTDPDSRVYFLSNYTQTGDAPKVGFQSNIYKDYHQSVTVGTTGEQLSALDGAWDVATWYNASNNIPYAIVTGYNDNGVTVLNMTDPAGVLHVATNLTEAVSGGGTATTDRPNLALGGPTGIETFYIPQDGTGLSAIPYAILTAFDDNGIQLLDLSDPEHIYAAGAKAGYQTGTKGGLVPPGTYANATDGSQGFNLLAGALDVAVWNTTATNHYAIVVAQQDNAFVILDISDPTAKLFEKQLSNGSNSYGQNWNITSPSAVTVFKTDANHYVAAIATNGTGTDANRASTISLIDLYQPASPMPITTTVSDGVAKENGGDTFNQLGGIDSIASFYLAGDYYLMATAYDDDAFTLIKLTGDKPSSGGASKICGYNYDCEPPTVSKSGGSIAINNAVLDTSSRYNDVDTTTSKVGQLVTIKANIYDEQAVYKTNLYFDMQGASDWNNANAAIKYTVSGGDIEIIDSNDIFSADVDASQVGDILQVTFKIMFTGPMDTSNVAIQSIDDSTNYQILYFNDALQVTDQSTGATPTSADDVLGDEVTQTSATVPDWVKNTAGWWADGAISEGEFVRGIEFLIQEQIIDTEAQTTSSEGTGASIPDWVKNTAGWWADGAISEGEFVNAIEHLVKTGTIVII